MGQATDRKVMEIEETRRRIEADLREMEARVPAPLRSLKSLVGIVVGSTLLTAFILRRFRSRRSNGPAPTEVVVRVVRDDD